MSVSIRVHKFWLVSTGKVKPTLKINPKIAFLFFDYPIFRSAYDEQHPLSQDCAQNVHRVLRERAGRVNLIPDVEENCRDALSEYCSHNVKPMEEMKCLQEVFEKPEFNQHYPKCYKELYKFTEMESKDTKLNRLLTRACRPVIETYCVNVREQDIDHGDVVGKFGFIAVS
jgi:Golgi apparatus protein 1